MIQKIYFHLLGPKLLLETVLAYYDLDHTPVK